MPSSARGLLVAQQDDLIGKLASALGIAASYLDQNGIRVDTGLPARRAVIEGLGFATATEAQVRDALHFVVTQRGGPLPPWIVVESRKPQSLRLAPAFAQTITGWALRGENGCGDRRKQSGGVDLPALESGYYHLDIEAGTQRASTFLLVAPPRCWSPKAFSNGMRGWGIASQVYGLRSERNFGMGDFADVSRLAEGAARAGASFLGLSPLHALFSADRSKISPYSPSTRLFLEPLYLDPDAINVAGADLSPLMAKLAPRIHAMRGSGLVDYAGVWEIKRPLLESLFNAFLRAGDDGTFARRRAELGEQLELHATFEAFSEHFSALGQPWPGVWPSDYFEPTSPAVQRFRRDKADRVSFHAWLQTLCDAQLAEAERAARQAGMEVGLYRDLAVGADRFGSEVWARQDRYALSLTVGAPPDPLGPQGQNWGFPPFDPLALERQDFAAFRDLVVANMRHAGAIRIDHAFQLQRLFLIPPGSTPAGGAYVDFPFAALLAILRIESQRRECLVIAEDLGTGPAEFSDAIMQSGILSYRVLAFERQSNGDFVPPADYPREALAAITTHDLPTFKGWMRGYDIDLRSCFGVYDDAHTRAKHIARQHDVTAWTTALQEEGLTGALTDDVRARNDALRYLARAPSRLLAVQCEDVLDELNQANLPGPSDGHPNWRRKLGSSLERLTEPAGPLACVGALMAEEGRTPRVRQSRLAAPPPLATYRLQLHKGFTFDMAREIVPYLAALGISHVYTSPIQKAQTGSTHGYDIVDPRVVNPELGGEDAFNLFVEAVHANGLKLLVDIVPNHMGIGAANPFWFSLLEWGVDSPFAHIFDIDLERADAGGKLLLPVLGSSYGDALASGDLSLAFDGERGAFVIRHFDSDFPICPREYGALLDRTVARIDGDLAVRAGVERLARAYRRIVSEHDAVERADALRRGLVSLSSDERAGAAIDAALRDLSADQDALDALISRQSYRLAHWRLAASELNYRRFFEINTLAGVRVEDPRVFDLTHELILRLVAERKIDGLRIDHIDGLADPGGYLRMLQEKVGPGFFIVAEKILEPGEELRAWPIAGTTGYDALNEIDSLLLDQSASARLQQIYRDVVGEPQSYHDALVEAKTSVLARSFGAEHEAIVADLAELAGAGRRTRDLGIAALRRAVASYVVALPVYRTYVGPSGAEPDDRNRISGALRDAGALTAPGDQDALAFLGRVLVGDFQSENRDLILSVRRRVEQLSGPIMAKSVEDTLFYRHVPFLALNEVGADPGRFGMSRDEFDDAERRRAHFWPASMIATATHDTKRGEDTRARLLALSADVDSWARVVERFFELTEGPDASDRVLMLQAMVGAWPLGLVRDVAGDAETGEFRQRFEAFAIKALREAKRHSSWTDPDEDYENSTKSFVRKIFAPRGEAFELIHAAAGRVAFAGALNALARTVFKITLPGVPDFYQGTEYWDFSFVDPDNRRPVDYAARSQSLTKMSSALPQSLLAQWQDGEIKQFITWRLLQDRMQRPELYAYGNYEPRRDLPSIAYERVLGDERLIICAMTGTDLLRRGLISGPEFTTSAWKDAVLNLSPGHWRNLLTGSAFDAQGTVVCAAIAEGLPWLVLGNDA
ncbi:MAG: malto-oligosyltrehalose synthase [Hyphomicrobiales bacterium]|nr:malto-oligosyltrehalose synthase [Hyphomicrobiales bacterium]